MVEVVVHGFDDGPIFFPANSWIHTRNENPESRIVFRNEVSICILVINFAVWNFWIRQFYVVCKFCANVNDDEYIIVRRYCHRKHQLA